MRTTNVRVLNPMHPATQIAIALRQKRSVKVIRHQTGAKNRHRNLDARMLHRPQKTLIVAIPIVHFAK